MKRTIICLVILAFVGSASATGLVTYGGTGGNANANAAALANGGAGGSVVGSGNSANRNDNTNLQGQGQLQGQQQGQTMGQGQTATSGVTGSGNSSSYSGGGSSNQTQTATSSSGGNTQSNAGNNAAQNSTSNVTVQGDTYAAQARNPVATAYSGPLTASNGTCMGSSSAGAQGVGFGVSIGSTWTDSSCDMRYDAQALVAAGMAKAALARLCQKPEIARAMESAGTACPQAKQTNVGTVKAEAVISGTGAYTDPIIRSRLNLPPQ